MAQAEYQRESSFPADPHQMQPGHANGLQRSPIDDAVDYLRDYARERPDVAAMWCFGIGFVLGWKLKPW